jgi:hypothetical protein
VLKWLYIYVVKDKRLIWVAQFGCLKKGGRKTGDIWLVGCFKLARRSFLVQEISNGQTTHNRREGGVGVKTFRALPNQRLESKHMLHVHAIEELVSMVLRPTKHVDFKNQSRFIYDFIHH